jgi:hypothetical protein
MLSSGGCHRIEPNGWIDWQPVRSATACFPPGGKNIMSHAMSKLHPPIVELHFENASGRVRIVPPDRDIMAMPVEVAVEACRAFRNQILFKDQFDLLLNHLAAWLQPREDRISAAYLTARDAGLLFLVVLSGQRRDKEIEAALTELDLEVANDKDFSLISFSTHAIPSVSEDTVRSFLSEKLRLRYVLNAERAGPRRLREPDPENDPASSL